MKQVLQNLKTGETIVAEVPIPQARPGQALVRNAVSLVSTGTERMLVDFAGKSLVGKARSRPDLAKQVIDKARREGLLTTLSAAFNRLEQPMLLGYSSAGTIESLGTGMSGYHVGQRVACAGGGYAVHAEYVSVPANLLASLPDEVDFESAAFTTLGAIALHGYRLAEVQIGERVAVIGLGLLGMLAAQIALAAGCQVMGVDIDPQRVSLAKHLGFEAVLRDGAEGVSQGFTRGIGFDAVLICADTPSTDPVQLAGKISRDRARVVAVGAVGLELPRKVFYEKELTFINSRSYGPGRYDPSYEESGRDYPLGYVRWTEGRNLQAFVDLLASQRVDVKALVSHRFPVERAPEAYQLINSKGGEAFLGVLLTYPGPPVAEKDVVQIRHPSTPGESADRSPNHEQVKPGCLNLGVLGAGNFATAVMLPAIQAIEKIELSGIASASGASAQHAAQRYNFKYAVSDEDRILNDPAINTIAILTRHNQHARQTIAALGAGKNVFCEKPLALNETELDEIIEVLKRAQDQAIGVNPENKSIPLLMVGYNRRFAPLTTRLVDFLSPRPEPFYAHYRVNAGYLPLDHWTQDPVVGGGRIIGEACHFIDFITHLAGEPPLSVSAQTLPDYGRYRQDNISITLNFPDGSLGLVSYLANGDKAFPKERVEVFCGGRVAALDDFRSLELVAGGKRQVHRSRLRQDKGHQGEWIAFRDAILAGTSAPIPYDQMFGISRACFAALESLRSNEQVTIKLDL